MTGIVQCEARLAREGGWGPFPTKTASAKTQKKKRKTKPLITHTMQHEIQKSREEAGSSQDQRRENAQTQGAIRFGASVSGNPITNKPH